MRPVRLPRWRALALASVAATAFGCTDTSAIAPILGKPELPKRMITALQVDASDTWLSADIESQTSTTVTTDEPVTNPVTGVTSNTVTTTSEPEQLYLGGGFDSQGMLQAVIHADLSTDPSADPGSQVTETRIVGDHVEFYDGTGRRMPDVASDGTALPTLLAQDLTMSDGGMTGGAVVDDPSVLTAEPVPATMMDRQASPGQMRAAIASVANAIRHRVEQPDENTLILVQEVDDAIAVTESAAASRISADAVSGDVSSAPSGPMVIRRTYRRHGGKEFILDEIRAERSMTGPKSHAVTAHVMRYRNVKWHRNKAKDDERAAQPQPVPVPTPPRRIHPMLVDDGSGGGASEPPASAGTDDCYGGYSPERSVVGSGTGQHLVFQHGFSETGCLYRAGRTRVDVESMFRIDDDLMPTTDYHAPIASQAATLAPRVNAARTDGQGSIFIGYSNGGLISRHIAQTRASNVKGVVTVSTPNSGIPVVKLGYNAILAILGPLNFFISPTDVLGPVVKVFGIGGDGQPVPVMADDITGGGSGYLDALNASPESFVRTGIVQRPAQRWLYRRVGRTGKCSTSFTYPCGRQGVIDAENMYAHLRAVTVVHWTWNPFKLAARIAQAAWAGAQMVWYNAVDGLFNFIIAPTVGDGSDGLVPFSSQRYRSPSTPNYEILGADSHAEAYGSDKVTRQALADVLRRPSYGLLTRQ